MYVVRVFVVGVLLCALHCSVEVESFGILQNVADKIGNKIQRIHKALHPHHGDESVVLASTTASEYKPTIYYMYTIYTCNSDCYV